MTASVLERQHATSHKPWQLSLVQVGHDVGDGLTDRAEGVVEMLISLTLNNVPHAVVEGAAVWGAGRPNFWGPAAGHVLLDPPLHHLGLVGRSRVLSEDIRPFNGNGVHPGLHYVPQYLNVFSCIDPQTSLKTVGRGHVFFAEDHDNGGELRVHYPGHLIRVIAQPLAIPPVDLLCSQR